MRYNKSVCHHRTPCCFILPPSILDEIIKTGTDEQKTRALRTLRISERLRGQRKTLSRMHRTLFASGSLQKHRMIYDMHHSENEELLPGTKIRDEATDTATTSHKGTSGGEEEVDNAFENTGHTYDFYSEVFNRNSVDDAGAILISSINFGEDFDNAFWNGRQMAFGNGGGGIFKEGSLTASLDVIAHELTHGVTSYTADLAYMGESGGLNEAFSDIFGIMCTQWTKKQTVSDSKWLIGEGIMEIEGSGLRDMKGEQKANPYDKSIFSYKDYKKGLDVHWTSGIANKAFYLTAKKIGRYSWEKAGKIWFIVLTQGWLSRFGPTIDGRAGRSFQEAADATFTVAGELFGEGSDEQKATEEGWKGVDIIPKEMKKPMIQGVAPFEQLAVL